MSRGFEHFATYRRSGGTLEHNACTLLRSQDTRAERLQSVGHKSGGSRNDSVLKSFRYRLLTGRKSDGFDDTLCTDGTLLERSEMSISIFGFGYELHASG